MAAGYGPRDFGEIYKTTDGGSHWIGVSIKDSTGKIFGQPFTSLQFLDENTGYILGLDYQASQNYRVPNQIYKTSNGGKSWENIHSFDDRLGNRLASMCFLDTHTAYAVGYSSILKSTDGGANWSETKIEGIGLFTSLQFPNQEVGFAVGSGSLVMKIQRSKPIKIIPKPLTRFELIPMGQSAIYLRLIRPTDIVALLFDAQGKLALNILTGRMNAGAQIIDWDWGKLPRGNYVLDVLMDGTRQSLILRYK